ncbi:MAG: cysteine--tRNA ligase, partial [Verrucomicrobiaceae bacterium]
MYVCGPTVYDTPHLGNARPAVVFDILFRLLRSRYDDVTYARNLTDIDDKIMERAALNGVSIQALTNRTIAEYHEIVDALGCLRPTYSPR